MRVLFRNRTLLITDLVGWSVLPLAALFVRLDGVDGFAPYLQRVILFTGWALLFQFLAMYAGGMYRGAWRYASIEEFSGIAGCLAVAAVAAAAVHFWVGQYVPLSVGAQRLPRSLPLINAIFAIAWSSGTRFVLRYAAYLRQRATGKLGRRRAVLVGATPEMGSLIGSLMEDPRAPIDPVVVVGLNDGAGDHGYLSGIRVLGELRDLMPLLRSHHASVIVLYPAAMTRDQIRRVWDLARQIQASVQVIPSTESLARSGWRAVRDLAIEDLYVPATLGGPDGATRVVYAGRRVLVTGAAGVLGGAVAHRLAGLGVKQLLLLDHSEDGLWRLTGALQHEYPGLDAVPLVTDVRDVRRVETLFTRHQPDFVIHAASLHNAELMEANPEEAVLTTVGSTFAVARAAEMVGVEHFVHASSDLAVEPTCVLGAAKLVAERYVGGIGHRTGRRFLSVRFGALLGERAGLPSDLIEMIRDGGVVHLPHPEFRRCLIGTEAAASVLLEAGALGAPGSTVLESGPPVRLVDLATDLARLLRQESARDLEFRFDKGTPGGRIVQPLIAADERSTVLSSSLLGVEHDAGRPGPTERWILALLQAAREGDLTALRSALTEHAPGIGAPPRVGIAAPQSQTTPQAIAHPTPRTSGGARAKAV